MGGRWQDGAAGSSGEDMEQLFSYLSRWGFPTKAMTAASTYVILSCDNYNQPKSMHAYTIWNNAYSSSYIIYKFYT